jgi:hypothetical protein
MASRHRKLVTTAILANAVALLSKYHEKGIDIFTCATEAGGSAPSLACAAALGHVDDIRCSTSWAMT